jgi:hypothetical protein
LNDACVKLNVASILNCLKINKEIWKMAVLNYRRKPSSETQRTRLVCLRQ